MAEHRRAEDSSDGDQAQLRKLISPVKGGERGRGDEHEYGAEGEQQAGVAGGFRLCAAARADRKAGKGQDEPGGEDGPGHVEPAPVIGQERDGVRPRGGSLVSEGGERGVGLWIRQDVRVELQVRPRVVFRPGAAYRREAVEEVPPDGLGVGDRLVTKDPQAEVAHHAVPGHAGRRTERPLG